MKILFLYILTLFSVNSFAQESSDLEVEALYDEYSEVEVRQKRDTEKPVVVEGKLKEEEITSLKQLIKLAPFEDVAVIQKRYLPKTNRFELMGSVTSILNNAFFNNLGATFRATYHLNEKYSAEFIYSIMTDSNRDITNNLRGNQNVLTESLVTPEGFVGAAFRWSPIYGKMALLNESVVPFDIFFSAGLGTTDTSYKSGETTIHLGAGQIFAITRDLAFRWDLSLNTYDATTEVEGNVSSKSQTDIYLSMGVSYFFPGAEGR